MTCKKPWPAMDRRTRNTDQCFQRGAFLQRRKQQRENQNAAWTKHETRGKERHGPYTLQNAPHILQRLHRQHVVPLVPAISTRTSPRSAARTPRSNDERRWLQDVHMNAEQTLTRHGEREHTFGERESGEREHTFWPPREGKRQNQRENTREHKPTQGERGRPAGSAHRCRPGCQRARPANATAPERRRTPPTRCVVPPVPPVGQALKLSVFGAAHRKRAIYAHILVFLSATLFSHTACQASSARSRRTSTHTHASCPPEPRRPSPLPPCCALLAFATTHSPSPHPSSIKTFRRPATPRLAPSKSGSPASKRLSRQRVPSGENHCCRLADTSAVWSWLCP